MFSNNDDNDFTARYHELSATDGFSPDNTGDLSSSADAFGAFPRSGHFDLQPSETWSGPVCFGSPLYAESHHHSNYVLNGSVSPGLYPEDPDMTMGSSSLSTASAPSVASSAIGSPQSNHGHMSASIAHPWSHAAASAGRLGLQPSIVGNDYIAGHEYAGFAAPGMDEMTFDFTHNKGFVDPSLIHPEIGRPHHLAMPPTPYDAHFQPASHAYSPYSPSITASSPQPNLLRTNSSSPFLHSAGPFPPTAFSPYATPMDHHHHLPHSAHAPRRPSMSNYVVSPGSGEYGSGDETKEKQRCTYPDCGKIFKDLKAHMLTHQTERPEKCPIQTCEYHVKGFARKYDKNRHTLTHYKGTMVCGFCPGSGSAAEKSFNRADVFKRHLTAVHGVEQTPPNSRKKTTPGVNAGKRLSGYAPDATGKCSTCSQTFSNAQDFYEHLDDCVLRIVQQEDPAEAINAKRLAEVENDKDVHETLEKNNLPTTTEATKTEDDDEDYDMGDDDEEVAEDASRQSGSSSSPNSRRSNPSNGVQKSRGMTHSRGGVPVAVKTKGRKNRRDYPSSWGFDKGQMTMKKRVLTVFDGPRRLAKDDMMLSTDCEVRIKLSDGKSYITDLDTQTIKRAEGFHGATESEKGPWLSDDPTEQQVQQMQEMQDMLTAN